MSPGRATGLHVCKESSTHLLQLATPRHLPRRRFALAATARLQAIASNDDALVLDVCAAETFAQAATAVQAMCAGSGALREWPRPKCAMRAIFSQSKARRTRFVGDLYRILPKALIYKRYMNYVAGCAIGRDDARIIHPQTPF